MPRFVSDDNTTWSLWRANFVPSPSDSVIAATSSVLFGRSASRRPTPSVGFVGLRLTNSTLDAGGRQTLDGRSAGNRIGIGSCGEAARRSGEPGNASARKGIEEMVTVGLLVRLEAKPGKEAELQSFLEGGLEIVEQEPETTAWFAIRLGPSEFGIFDVFPDDSGRQAHLSGAVAAALIKRADELLASPPDIQNVDVLASKLPG
jgi:quinol monooxygenase YgiN